MRRVISIILICSLMISACAPKTSVDYVKEEEDVSYQNEADTNTVSQNTNRSDEQASEPITDEEKDSEADTRSSQDTVEPVRHFDTTLDIKINGLDDEALLKYVEDSVYLGLINDLDSDKYFIENIEAVYYPKEYIEALASNSSPNKYFGFTSAELNEEYQGSKYLFTLGDDGQTVVVPMETFNDDVYVKAMEDVLIGTGVILVCVTVSAVASPVAPAVSVIFAASASTGTTFALESGAISFAAATIVKGYETESIDQALKAGAKAAGEGFKWGAISGAALGGAGKTVALMGGTKSGLTMNEVALIQKESGLPIDIIKQIKSFEEYEIYKKAGLYTKMIDGKIALVRDIPLDYVSELPTGEKVTNLVRMQKGYAPIDPATGKAYQLHHINQNSKGTLAILTEAEHQGNASILNTIGKESEINRKEFDEIRKVFWQKFAESLA